MRHSNDQTRSRTGKENDDDLLALPAKHGGRRVNARPVRTRRFVEQGRSGHPKCRLSSVAPQDLEAIASSKGTVRQDAQTVAEYGAAPDRDSVWADGYETLMVASRVGTRQLRHQICADCDACMMCDGHAVCGVAVSGQPAAQSRGRRGATG